MGTRGKLPSTILASKPLKDLTPPDWLGDEGKKHWIKHAQIHSKNGLLTVQTADSFALHCDLWERLMEFRGEPTSRSYLDTYARYVASAKLFRMFPTEKPSQDVEHRGQIAEEFKDDEDF